MLESDAGSLGASREERGGEEEYGEGGDTSSAQATAHPSQNRFSNLLNEAILAPGENEMTPLHSLLASFCETYDVKTMRLFISKLPQTYTAQQLLKLFQKRYPSAYKAEIFKQESGVEGEEGAGSGLWWLRLVMAIYMVATSFKSHEICRISTSFVLLHIAFILLL